VNGVYFVYLYLVIMSLYVSFKKERKAVLQKKLAKTNTLQVPEIDKVVVAVGIGSLATRKGVKDFSDIEKNLMTITGQKPQMILSKQSISNFKLREDMPVMLRCTLRAKKAYDFLDRLVQLVLPRVRDFQGIHQKKFDGRGNYTFGLPSQAVFAEINLEELTTPIGIQITIVTTTTIDEEAKALLESLGFIFLKI
ncbi:MAG: 50S ribosomal protein L5, partial [bacterium]|nr:50S ribosomal protein L5 [bacterium]